MEASKSLTVNTGKTDIETGLEIKTCAITKSGFVSRQGIRQYGELQIIEGVASANGTIFLNSIIVKDKNGKLLFDADVKRSTFYTREKTRELVLHGLIGILRDGAEANGYSFDEIDAYNKLDKNLKATYFTESYDAMINVARNIGIEIFKNEE
jgi:hypothetical protein